MKILIITEKANAARRIATILSDGNSHSASAGGVTSLTFSIGNDDYNVVSLRGHIMELDYPEKYGDWKATSPVELVSAPQIKTVRVKSILSKISELAKESDEIIIATDYDREGELIGMETVKAANADMAKVRRAKFSALTKGEIKNAFANLVEPDEKLANAARRIATILSDGKPHSASAGGVTSLTFNIGSDDYNVVSLRGHIME
ncbi:MAG: hypothetical protein IIU13_03440, partial [Candidatus Methanomethylophilus sp.]|nr:hypothetical protein [Methanomethylophilus sp.]